VEASRYAHLADDPIKKAANEISMTIHAAFTNRAELEIIPLEREA
jgi:hypothetical protein